ncbi:MAG TPA: PIG-L family deacetylase [Candidatus Saccharimonadales bacterium]|nr:PIG-L family deacetylase [Candidatus Saccharimonadales bacterium]
MKTMHHVLAGETVGLITAHPDDHLIHAHSLEAARYAANGVHELIATQGRGSTLNYRRAEGFDVRGGQRSQEARAAAALLGIQSVRQLDARDGNLTTESASVVPATARWLIEREISLVLTLGGLTDHPDHSATTGIAQAAARAATEYTGQPIRIFAVHANGAGKYHTEATPDSMARAYQAAALHGSQFLLSQTVRPDWPIVPGGFSAHPDTAAGLGQYPILFDASYSEYGPVAPAGAPPEIALAASR